MFAKMFRSLRLRNSHDMRRVPAFAMPVRGCLRWSPSRAWWWTATCCESCQRWCWDCHHWRYCKHPATASRTFLTTCTRWSRCKHSWCQGTRCVHFWLPAWHTLSFGPGSAVAGALLHPAEAHAPAPLHIPRLYTVCCVAKDAEMPTRPLETRQLFCLCVVVCISCANCLQALGRCPSCVLCQWQATGCGSCLTAYVGAAC